MAVYNPEALPKYDAADLGATVRRLWQYTRAAQDDLAYLLAHLDGDNIEGYEEIFNRLTDAEGHVSRVQQTAEEISALVYDNSGNIAALTQRADGVEARVSAGENAAAALTVRADAIESTVADNSRGLSAVTQTASGLQVTVADLNGKYSRLQQTVDGFDFTGYVTFRDLDDELASYPTNRELRRGETTISGGCITTGTINLENVELANDYGGLTMADGSTGVMGTKGAKVTGSDSNYYMIVTDAAVRLSAKKSHFYIGSNTVYCTEDLAVTSDARLKQDFCYDLADRYADFYRALRPCRFRMTDGTSGRFHTGFAAQELEAALTAGGLDNSDLAALVHINEDGFERYAIRYSELIALNTAMIRRLQDEVAQLKNKEE